MNKLTLNQLCIGEAIMGIPADACPGPNQELSEALGKPACRACLKPCWRVMEMDGERVIDLQQQVHELTRAAETDELTKLLNRRAFERKLQERMLEGEPFGLAMVDVRNFGIVNQREGHLGGDLMLNLTAQYLEDSVRTGDNGDHVTCRYGGDEFAIILDGHQRDSTSELSWDDLYAVRERILTGYGQLEEVVEYNSMVPEPQQLGLKIEVGLWIPSMEREELIAMADPKGKGNIAVENV